MTYDLLVVGGGPAGLAAALEAAQRGRSVVVFERSVAPVDKACGEGLMPSGLEHLERLGVLSELDRSQTAPFDSIRFVQEDGRSVVGRLPMRGGLGIRRLALSEAMRERARQEAVELREENVIAHRIEREWVEVTTGSGTFRGKLLVAADGLNSRLRRAEGLALRSSGSRRFGLRRHASCPPWSRSVEVHFSEGVEAYVTPVGPRRVGVALLFEEGALPTSATFDEGLRRFPRLLRALGGADWDSEPRGAGPLRQLVSRRTKHRFVLVGDAAGYVDAITGEGLSLAFEGAAVLGRSLASVLDEGASLGAVEQSMRRAFDRYAGYASLLVGLARRPKLRRAVVNGLVRHPKVFEATLGWMTRHESSLPRTEDRLNAGLPAAQG